MKKLVFSLITFGFVLLAVEVGVRCLYFQKHARDPIALMTALRLISTKWEQHFPGAQIGIWQKDPVYGYDHTPSASGRHETEHYGVTYTIGPDRSRVIPVPDDALGSLLFLGGSFTFGHGVEDAEPFPALLARQWPRWRVVNRAVMGWGSAHAYLALKESLSADQPPSAVVYTMIPSHQGRNYIRKSWLETMARYDRDHPHFEVENDALQSKGVVGVAQSLPDSEELAQREIELTNAFLSEMARLCKARGIPFTVVLLRKGHLAAIYKTFVEHEIAVIDLSDLPIEGFPGDPHPNPEDHRRIADGILKQFQPPSR